MAMDARQGLESQGRLSVERLPDLSLEFDTRGLEDVSLGEGVRNDSFVEPKFVGSLFWTLRRGDQWVLAPESAFLFRDCWRTLLAREAYMLEQPSTARQRWRDAGKTFARRWITGEPLLLDLYEAQRDGAELVISSDEIGGNLCIVDVGRIPLICRKTVYFGSELDVALRVRSPILERFDQGTTVTRLDRFMRMAYGPGWVFQRFEARPGGRRTRVILQVDGDACVRELRAGDTLRIDPRHAYAWEETVGWRLVKFGAVIDRLLRGSIPFQVEFRGPGRVWLSNKSFGDGYMGEVFTPSHWIYRAHQGVRRLLSLLNPFNWL